MTPQEAILASVNERMPREKVLREFFEHRDWWIPRPSAHAPPTIIVDGEVPAPQVWLFSSSNAYKEGCDKLGAAAIGPVFPCERLDGALADLDSRVLVARIDPASPISYSIQTDALEAVRRFARGVRVEHAMAEHRFADIRTHAGYYVPYYGVLGQGHEVVCLPTERGSMIAAFTTEDAVVAFLATGTDEDRARVKFVAVDGEALFVVTPKAWNKGVIVNWAGPHTFGFDLDGCRDVATG